MLDAYTLRKVVPRILIGAIGINLSIYLCVAAIDITNIIGGGLSDLIRTPFLSQDTFADPILQGNFENDVVGVVGVGGVLTVIVGAVFAFSTGAVTASGIGIAILMLLLMLVVTFGFVALAILATLVIRTGLLVFLSVLSPLAIAAFILPGTEKYFRSWWSLFTKTLMVYPVIASIFAMSDVMAAIFLSGSNTDQINDVAGLVGIIVGTVAVYLPLFLIPFAFKLAGGVIGQIYDFAGKGTDMLGNTLLGSKDDPDSLRSKIGRNVQSRRADAGLTARQFGAMIGPGGAEARSRRVRSARRIDQFRAQKAEAEADRFKISSQDSDVQDSLLMSSEDIRSDKEMLRRQVQAGVGQTLRDENGNVMTDKSGKAITGISQSQYERRMQAHADADAMGRTSANKRAAFLNGDRIKFSSNSYDQERALALQVFGGDEAAMAEAMNAHQAVATSVGRANLAQALYGNEGDPVRGSSKAGAGGIMAGHSNGVKSSISDLTSVLNDQSGKYGVEQKVQAAQTLASMQSLSKSPFGQGNEENKRLVQQNQQAIDSALSSFTTDPSVATTYVASGPNKGARASYLHADLVKANPELKNAREVQQYDQAAGGLVKKHVHKDTGVEIQPEIVVSGAEAAQERLRQMAGSGVDPAVAAAQQEQQKQQQQQKGDE